MELVFLMLEVKLNQHLSVDTDRDGIGNDKKREEKKNLTIQLKFIIYF